MQYTYFAEGRSVGDSLVYSKRHATAEAARTELLGRAYIDPHNIVVYRLPVEPSAGEAT